MQRVNALQTCTLVNEGAAVGVFALTFSPAPKPKTKIRPQESHRDRLALPITMQQLFAFLFETACFDGGLVVLLRQRVPSDSRHGLKKAL